MKDLGINECRFCLETPNILETETFDVLEESIQKKIMLCLNMEIRKNDQMPKLICKNCRFQLEKNYYFRVKAKHTETKLRKHIRLINAGKESNLLSKTSTEEDDEEDDEMIELNQNMLECNNFFEEIEREKQELIQKEISKINEEKEQYKQELKDSYEIRFKKLQKKYENDRKTMREKEVSNIFNRMKTFVLNETAELTTNTVHHNFESEVPVPEPNAAEQEFASMPVDIIEFDATSSLKGIKRKKSVDKAEIINFSEKIQKRAKKSTMFSSQTSEQETIDYVIESYDSSENLQVQDQDQNVIRIVNEDIRYFTIEENEVHPNSKDDGIKIVSYVGSGSSSQQPSQENIYTVVKTEPKDFYYVTLPDDGTLELDENGEKKILKCAKCDLTFSRRVGCKNHYLSHAVLNGYECDYCKKKFLNNSAYQRHIRVHTGERPYKCNYENCDKSFTQNEVLKRHLAIHSDKFSFECTMCDKKFKLKDQLKQHYLSHAKQQYACTLCEKVFTYSSGLSRHMLTHSGKSYDCQYCQKAFNDYSAMKRHEKSVHSQINIENIKSE